MTPTLSRFAWSLPPEGVFFILGRPGDEKSAAGRRFGSGAAQARGLRGGHQNAGTTAPWYLSWMNFFTSGVCSAFTSLAIAGSLARSARAAMKLA
ncbi:hypothetical protein ACAN107058_08235 [Paracidovorax anthurii]|uniref:Uncharacterized protein n=1 Tax=Paracidovorax anthurii TaxID=78229 RepID=A0A328ZG26_9BURK|nr:hypothetical protein AX018_100831 [Paracidovorax anthurii]